MVWRACGLAGTDTAPLLLPGTASCVKPNPDRVACAAKSHQRRRFCLCCCARRRRLCVPTRSTFFDNNSNSAVSFSLSPHFLSLSHNIMRTESSHGCHFLPSSCCIRIREPHMIAAAAVMPRVVLFLFCWPRV